jgi:molybdate transport repressor ModE-like protein
MSLRKMQGRIALEDLRLVHAIGTAGTLAGAARRLGVDHSTAFRRLGQLEQRLGARLFERARVGYTPTPAGEAAVVAAAELLDSLEKLEHRLAGEDLRPAGMVRVTTTDTLLDFLSPALAAFRSAHPEITLEVAAENAFLTLTKRDADIAVRPSLTVPEHLVGRRIAALATAPYASREYMARRSGTVDLREHHWIAPDENLRHLGSARWIARELPPARIVLKGTSLLALVAAARAGIGVAPIPCYLGDADRRLVRLAAPIPEMSSALWLLTHPDLRRVARVHAVMEFLAPLLGEKRGLLEGRGSEATAGPCGQAMAGPTGHSIE